MIVWVYLYCANQLIKTNFIILIYDLWDICKMYISGTFHVFMLFYENYCYILYFLRNFGILIAEGFPLLDSKFRCLLRLRIINYNYQIKYIK
jgi:hypothetical protein